MFSRKFYTAILLVCSFISACGSSTQAEIKPATDKSAEEKSKRNPIKKGRYQCRKLTADSNEVVSPLYILSDELYQFEDAVGKYRFDKKVYTVHWIDGPFYKPTDEWIGVYKSEANALPTITIQQRSDINAGNKRITLQCTWSEFQY